MTNLRVSIEDADEKLRQQIAEGESVRELGVVSFTDLAELRSEKRIWAEYTWQVLESLFDSREQADGFHNETHVYERGSGTAMDFARDEREAVLLGVTYLKSLRRRLPLIVEKTGLVAPQELVGETEDTEAQAVYELLRKLNTGLASSYKQIRRDLEDATRLSYRGTANEMREILREVLDRLAPDDEVIAQRWYKPTEKGQSGERTRPTHQQKARYILEKNGAGSRVHDVAETSLAVAEEGLFRAC